MSHVTCQVSGVRCQVAYVKCEMSDVIFFLTNGWSLLVEALLSTEPTLSILQATKVFNAINEINIYKKKKAN